MRAAIPLLTLLFALVACGPKDEGTPLPTRTTKSSEGGFGGLNKQKQEQVPDKPLKYDPKHFTLFGLTPYPKLTSDDTATTESFSTQNKSDLTVKFDTPDPVETVSTFYAALLDEGKATPTTTNETTVVTGKTSTKADATVIVTVENGTTHVTIRANKVTQYEAK